MITDKAIATEPRHSQLQGDLLLKSHQSPLGTENLLEQALNAYALAMEEAPDNALLSSRMSKVFFLKGQYARALNLAQKALAQAQKPQSSPNIQREAQCEANYIVGLSHQRNGQLRDANQSFFTAMRFGGLHSARIRFSLFQNCRDLAMEASLGLQSFYWGMKAAHALVSSVLLLPFEPDCLPFSLLAGLIPRLLMAWVMEETSREEAALARYLQIAADYPALATVALVIGAMQREKGELSQARFWFEKVIRRHPGNLDAHYHLAQLLEECEEYQEMAEVYQHLDTLKPNDPHIHCNLANAYYYLHDYKEALNQYETALQLGTDAEWKGMVAQSIANIQFDYSQNSEAAMAYYHLARNFDPRNLENYTQLGMIYFQAEDYANAELIYRKALTIAPKNARLYSNLGYLRWLEADAPGAIEFYETAIRLDDSYEIPINNLGVIYLDMLGEVQRSIALFQQAIAIDKNYSLAYYNLGRAHSFLDNRLEAAHCLQMAQELNHFSRDLDNDELVARIQHLFETRELELLD
jgi:tetratricopeptide (TPR) repeat protein